MKMLPRFRFFALVAPFCAGMIIGPFVGADVDAPPPVPAVTAPYCGLLCLYAALKYEGAEVHFPSFVKPEYVGSSQGSTLAELRRCASDVGGYAVPVSGANWEFLQGVQHPVLLHVKSTLRSPQADHFVLFLRCEGGKARIMDIPGPAEPMTQEELSERADGLGLVVSKDRIDEASVFKGSWLSIGRLGGLIFGGSLFLGVAATRRRRANMLASDGEKRPSAGAYFGRAAYQAGMMIVLSVGIGFVFQSTIRGSAAPLLLRSRENSGRTLPLIPLKELHDRISQRLGIIVDARHIEDFQSGHIEGAINIPIDMPEGERRRILASSAPDTPIVVYCQSSGCPYSDAVGALLETDGYRSISIFRGGWVEWSTQATHN